MGLNPALQLAKFSLKFSTHQITIVLDNQGVVQDMSNKKTSSRALSQKIQATETVTQVAKLAPQAKISLCWCPGNQGVTGNVQAEKLVNNAAKATLPTSKTDKPSLSSFRAAIKAWL